MKTTILIFFLCAGAALAQSNFRRPDKIDPFDTLRSSTEFGYGRGGQRYRGDIVAGQRRSPNGERFRNRNQNSAIRSSTLQSSTISSATVSFNGGNGRGGQRYGQGRRQPYFGKSQSGLYNSTIESSTENPRGGLLQNVPRDGG